MVSSRLAIAFFLFAAGFSPIGVVAAQIPTDTVTRADSGLLTRAWFSLGVGGGNSSAGGFAARAAGSIAVTRLVIFTIEGTGVGNVEGSIDSINLMVGVQTPDPSGFLFASAGLANTSCGSGCAKQTGIAFDAGYHGGGRYAGAGVAAFVTRAHRGSNSGGVVLTLDVGWFGRHVESNNSIK